MAVRKDALEIKITAAEFNRAMARWPGLAGVRTEAVVDEVEKFAFASIRAKTPVGGGSYAPWPPDPHPGQARASWHVVKLGRYKRAIVSFLIYIRRLEVGWGAGHQLSGGGRRVPIGGYRMVRSTQKLLPRLIEIAAIRVRNGVADRKGA